MKTKEERQQWVGRFMMMLMIIQMILCKSSTYAYKCERLELDFVKRRWDSLMNYCIGNWSGSIGWYDIVDRSSSPSSSSLLSQRLSEEKGHFSMLPTGRNIPIGLVLRKESHKLNMRMTFHCRPENPEIADWIVCHARKQGSEENVVLAKQVPEKEENEMPTERFRQTFYAFEDGIIGRTGRSLQSFPVIEHDFWERHQMGGEENSKNIVPKRRTVVLVYSRSEEKNHHQGLKKICFLQQHGQPASVMMSEEDDSFDVSDTNEVDISNLPTTPTIEECMSIKARKELAGKWGLSRLSRSRTMTLDGLGRKFLSLEEEEKSQRIFHNQDALNNLLGISEDNNKKDDDNLLRVVLPNGVLIACPAELRKKSKSIEEDDDASFTSVSMGYQKSNGQVQVLELIYDRQVEGLPLILCRASYYNR